jgi:hypothetical protein
MLAIIVSYASSTSPVVAICADRMYVENNKTIIILF